MRDPRDIIKKPIITEKTTTEMQDMKYTFAVDIQANKIEIKNAVEKFFNVKVKDVNTMRMTGKVKRMGVPADVVPIGKSYCHPGRRQQTHEILKACNPGRREDRYYGS